MAKTPAKSATKSATQSATKTPAKSATAAPVKTAAKAATKAPAKAATKTTAKSATENAGSPTHTAHQGASGPSREEIAKLAYTYWEQSGRHHGHDDTHWARAERELRGHGSHK